jgi:hypothetical protein
MDNSSIFSKIDPDLVSSLPEAIRGVQLFSRSGRKTVHTCRSYEDDQATQTRGLFRCIDNKLRFTLMLIDAD